MSILEMATEYPADDTEPTWHYCAPIPCYGVEALSTYREWVPQMPVHMNLDSAKAHATERRTQGDTVRIVEMRLTRVGTVNESETGDPST